MQISMYLLTFAISSQRRAAATMGLHTLSFFLRYTSSSILQRAKLYLTGLFFCGYVSTLS